jgi:hypothetical protein
MAGCYGVQLSMKALSEGFYGKRHYALSINLEK